MYKKKQNSAPIAFEQKGAVVETKRSEIHDASFFVGPNIHHDKPGTVKLSQLKYKCKLKADGSESMEAE